MPFRSDAPHIAATAVTFASDTGGSSAAEPPVQPTNSRRQRMKKPIKVDEIIKRRIEARGETYTAESYAAETVAMTNAGLLKPKPSKVEEFLAGQLIELIAAGIGSKDPNMKDSDRDKACKLLLEAFRSGRFKLVAVGAKWIVVRPAAKERGGEVVVCTLESE
jgi:hypothetical protein